MTRTTWRRWTPTRRKGFLGPPHCAPGGHPGGHHLLVRPFVGSSTPPAYDSKVQPIYGDAHGGPMHYWPHVTTNVKSLVTRRVIVPFQLVVDFAHDHGMEAFASIRMNDVHDSFMGPNAMTVWKLTHHRELAR